MWINGVVTGPDGNDYYWWAKQYPAGSQYGIAGGRISKLEIKAAHRGRSLYHYDRGLDVPPAFDEVECVLEMILDAYN